MEFFVVLAIIIVLCIILGVGADVMIMGVLILIGLVIAAMAVFFIAFGMLLLFSKKTDAVFLRIGKRDGGKFNTAFYKVEENEYPCFFPSEPKILYKKDKQCRVRLNKRFGLVFDTFSVVTCTVGFFFSISAAAAAVFIAFEFFIT